VGGRELGDAIRTSELSVSAFLTYLYTKAMSSGR
jgi:hypothetical protein